MIRAAAVLCLLLLVACASNNKSSIRVIDASTAVYEVPSKSDGVVVEPIAQHDGRGTLVLHGGGIFKRAVAAKVLALAGPDPHLCLIDTADNGQGEIYRLFEGFRGVRLSVLNLKTGDTALPDVLATLGDCTGFFFGGGAPQRLSETFRPGGRDSPALAVIRKRFETTGAVVAGSSAGAMIVGPLTLCECGARSSVVAVTQGELFRAPGFDLLGAPVLIDAHFFARGLLGRHMFALARDHLPVGVGIDEGTTVLVPGDGGPWLVLDGRSVAILRTPSGAEMGSLHQFGISILSPGDRFDPTTDAVRVASTRQQANGDSIPITWPTAEGIKYTYAATGQTRYYVGETALTLLDGEISVDPL